MGGRRECKALLVLFLFADHAVTGCGCTRRKKARKESNKQTRGGEFKRVGQEVVFVDTETDNKIVKLSQRRTRAMKLRAVANK